MITNPITIGQALKLEKYLSQQTLTVIPECPKPERLCRQLLPDNLNDLTFGELLELQSETDTTLMIKRCGSIILHLDSEIMNAQAVDVFGFIFWVGRELERIAALFASTRSQPTPEEIRAGINDLDFGPFGIIDWYARRMGISEHDDVLKFKWVRIYQCMKIDCDTSSYERRLREIIIKKPNK